MKNFLLLTASLLVISLSAAAQATKKAIIKTPGLHCEKCKNKVESYLSRQEGVVSVNADYRKKTTTVNWITDRTNIEEVKAHISNAGYDADDIEAEEFTYKRLPKECQIKQLRDSSNHN
jgi:copper chaperone CopZ